ncbi:hypothetical protein OIV83_004113 [Microbotryomycetes sp. JL201]|nr:hypothetical protein OIV83_004113 [Microbotryomycetes sp. JL201]
MSHSVPEASTSSTSARPVQKQRIQLPTDDPQEIVKLNRTVADSFQINKHKKDAARNWDIFYKNNKDGFFKDRHWTDRDFTELARLDAEDGASGKGKGKCVMEVGCGTGAFVYPLLERYPNTQFYAFDFSPRAVDLVKSHSLYDPARVHAFVHDLTCPPGKPSLVEQLESGPTEFKPDGSQFRRPDVISCIFVLSALPPGAQKAAVQSLVDILAPGGSLLLRDYALHDMAQLRFHALPSKGYATVPSLLSADADGSTSQDDVERGKAWYRRGDGTMSYFFTPEELDRLVQVDVVQDAADGTRFKMEGKCVVRERALENKAQQWDCTRRFVHASWRKVVVE